MNEKSLSPLWRFLLSSFFLFQIAFGGEWTPMRIWNSTAGTKIKAEASSLRNGIVTLETEEGKSLKVSIRKLVESDQTYLNRFFNMGSRSVDDDDAPDASDIETDFLNEKRDDVKHPIGQLVGAIKADSDSTYYLYIPESLTKGVSAPLLLWTGGGGGRSESLKRFENISEVTGMVLAVCVEARAGNEEQWPVSLSHCKDVVRHIARSVPIDTNSVFYGGHGSGAEVAIHNAFKMGSAGTITFSTAISRWSDGTTRGFHFMGGPARDKNRYRTAHAATRIGPSAMHWIYPGHQGYGNTDILEFGAIWVYTGHLYSEVAARSKEKKAFEERFKPWLAEFIEVSPWDGLFLVDHLIKTCNVNGEFRTTLDEYRLKLSENEENVKYVKGRKAIFDFSSDKLAGHGSFFESLSGHSTPKIRSAVKRLKKKYGELPELESILTDLGENTH